MHNSDVLQLLFPLPLEGSHAADLALEGLTLDAAQARAGVLLEEMFPAGSYELLDRWISVYALPIRVSDSLQSRRARVMAKMRELGRLDRAYFIALAEGLGFTVTLEELCPFMPGWSYAGDELGDDDADWCWRLWLLDQPGAYFRAGESGAGEYLSDDYLSVLAQIFEDLKPADTFVEFLAL